MEKKPATVAKKQSLCPLHIVLTVGIAAAYGISLAFCYEALIIDVIFWLICSLIPLGLFVAMCLKFHGIPQILRSRTGGIIMLVALAVLLVLVSILVGGIIAMISLALGILMFRTIHSMPVYGYGYYDKEVVVDNPDGSKSHYNVTIYNHGEATEKEQIDHALEKEGHRIGTNWRYQ